VTMTYPLKHRDKVNWFASGAGVVSLIQSGTLWQDAPEPIWKPRENAAWFDVVLPFMGQRSTTAWVEVYPPMSAPKVAAEGDTAAKLRAFHDWLDSLPAVPRIPLEALDRENLY